MRSVVRVLAPAVVAGATLVAASPGRAAPAPSSVEGALNEGATVTVVGAAFGATGPDVVLFDDFEGGDDGDVVKTGAGSATIGAWFHVGDSDPTKAHYTGQFTNSGARAGQINFEEDGSFNNSRGMNTAMLSSNVYASFWVYMPATSLYPGIGNPDLPNWKILWIYDTCTASSCDGRGDVFVANLPPDNSDPNSNWVVGGNECAYTNWFEPAFYHARWTRMGFYLHASSQPNASVWDLVTMERGKTALRHIEGESGTFHDTFVNLTTVCVGCYGRTTPGESRPVFDDVYVASGPGARARVEIGDQPTYDACTNLAVSTVTSWSDGAIDFVLRSGSFPSGPAYLYVVDADGAVNQAGLAIELGATATTGASTSSSGGGSPTAATGSGSGAGTGTGGSQHASGTGAGGGGATGGAEGGGCTWSSAAEKGSAKAWGLLVTAVLAASAAMRRSRGAARRRGDA
jgi:hypothetical protein